MKKGLPKKNLIQKDFQYIFYLFNMIENQSFLNNIGKNKIKALNKEEGKTISNTNIEYTD